MRDALYRSSLVILGGLDSSFACVSTHPATGSRSQHQHRRNQHRSALKMLRPRPSVISLTRADVTDVVHRRRFRRYLEFEEDDVCVDFAPVETDTTCKLDRHATPPSHTARRKTTPTTYDSTQNSSPIMNGGVHHWVKDVPLLLLSDKGVGEDVSPPPGVSGSEVRRSGTRGNPQQNPEWTLQLCLRPKPDLPVATTPLVDDGSTGSQDSRENPKGESLDETQQSGATAICEPGLSPSSCLSNVGSPSMRGGEANQTTRAHRVCSHQEPQGSFDLWLTTLTRPTSHGITQMGG
jgi:hypothetical protein